MLGVPAGAPACDAATAASSCERAYFRARRPVEVSVSLLALLLLMPLLALIALAVLVGQGRPILFRQLRPGRGMRPFTLYKFRTMRGPCDRHGTALPDAERISLVGRTLRRTRLDELPQLFNVVRGDMSFIGPRPLLARDQPGWVTERVAIRPGITGWAQVHGGQRLSIEEKIALDTWYVRNAGPWIDLRIVCRTLTMMGRGKELNRLEWEHARASEAERQRLLVVNRFFDPDPSATSQLLTDLVDALDTRGFAITVFAGRHTYLNTGTVLPARAWRAGVEVRRLRHTGFGRFSLPGRALDSATFAASAFLALLAHARPGDVILAKTDPPLISVVAWLGARLTGARLVNWCQDLFPENAAAIGLQFARGAVGAALRALRNASLRGAEMNVAVCASMAARLAAQGVPCERLTVIPNWADGELIRPITRRDNPLRTAWGLGERLVLGYSGNLGCAHLVDPVVELITLLADEPKLAFLFIGAGSGYGALRAAIAERRLENVVFRPYQDRAQLPLSLTAPDLHLVTLRPECEGLVMPSKLYGALAAGRPIVFIGDPEGDTARVVRDGPGLVASPEEIPALAEQIRALRRNPARLARMGAAARMAYDALPQRRQPRRLDPPPARRRPGRGGAPTAPARGGGMSSAAVTRRRITGVDLARYAAPIIPGNRSVAWRIAWHLVSALVFQSALVLPSRWKAAVLRCFGARIGTGPVIKARVSVKYPWFLELGDHVWLGEGVWIDNHTTVAVGSDVCISQGAYLFTGNHDWNDPRFRFFCEPITVGDGAWLGAKAIICPGSVLARLSVVGAGVVWRGTTAPAGVYTTPRPGESPARLAAAG